MKLKLIISLIVLSVTVALVYGSSKNEKAPPIQEQNTAQESTIESNTSVKEDSNQDFPKHIEEVSQKLFKNKDDQKISIELTPEKKKELEGDINREYGIREDILRFIEKEIPTDNVKAKNAAIKYSKYSRTIYYEANEKEALELSKKESLALECLAKALPENWIKLSDGIQSLMRNTSERDKHMWDIDKKYFSWKVLGNGGLTTSEVKEKCAMENY